MCNKYLLSTYCMPGTRNTKQTQSLLLYGSGQKAVRQGPSGDPRVNIRSGTIQVPARVRLLLKLGTGGGGAGGSFQN